MVIVAAREPMTGYLIMEMLLVRPKGSALLRRYAVRDDGRRRPAMRLAEGEGASPARADARAASF